VDGSQRYGIDVQLPGLLHASVRAAPVQGSTLLSVDESPARAMPGVKAVVKLPNAVAVVASSWWQAEQAVQALQPQFSAAAQGTADSAALFAAIESSLAKAGSVKQQGDVDAALAKAAQRIDARYQLPLLAHAALEPLNATVRVADGRCEVWAGTQDPLSARKVAAEAAGVSKDNVTLHNQALGGSFGRRLPGAFDYIDQATRIAKAMSPSPVKLLWSRSEDLQHDFYRPAMVAQLQGGVDAAGRLAAWRARYNGGAEAAAGVPPYHIDALDLRSSKHEAGVVREGSWRSVGFSQQCFVIESFIDELAHAAQQDPLAFRLAALQHAPRHRAVLQAAAQRAQWGDSLPAGQGRGIALVEAFGSLCAQVAQVQVEADGTIRVLRMVAAVDCGPVIHPDAALAQVQGGMLFGVSAALHGEITLQDGRVLQSGFGDYPQLRIDAAPQVEVEFLQSTAPLGGLGEPGVPPAAPALANAIFAATGKRLRELPLQRVLRTA
jgi:isoquinoline 1-oxidoreductase beta subunit